jgi:hypothetical protein
MTPLKLIINSNKIWKDLKEIKTAFISCTQINNSHTLLFRIILDLFWDSFKINGKEEVFFIGLMPKISTLYNLDLATSKLILIYTILKVLKKPLLLILIIKDFLLLLILNTGYLLRIIQVLYKK